MTYYRDDQLDYIKDVYWRWFTFDTRGYELMSVPAGKVTTSNLKESRSMGGVTSLPCGIRFHENGSADRHC